MRKQIPRDIREQVYKKYDGHCAYCGCKLKYKDMQVDHIESVYAHNGANELSNYMPACRQCNFYKSTFDIEEFRKRLSSTLIDNLKGVFNYRLAVKYGLIKENVKPVKFYYERCARIIR